MLQCMGLQKVDTTEQLNWTESNEAEVAVFLEFCHFFYDPTYVGNLVSGSSAFSKSSLYIWKFSIQVNDDTSYYETK